MANKHKGRIVPNFLIGTILISAGILSIEYDIKSRLPQVDKNLVSFGIIIIINAGLYFWGSGFVHKVKSDLIKKQKQHDQKDRDPDQ